MPQFYVEIHGPQAEQDARALQEALAAAAQPRTAAPPPSRGIDPVAVIAVSAALLQSVDILYRFYQDWRQRQQPAPGSRSTIIVVLGDNTRIDLAESDPEQVKARLTASDSQ